MEPFDYCPELGQLLRDGRRTGRTGKTVEVGGAASTVNNLLVLRALMLERKPQRTLEVGLAAGASCLAFTASHRDLGHQPQSQHVAIDPFQDTIWDGIGVAAVERAGLAGYLTVERDLSCKALPRLYAAGQPIDLAYIDGSHLFEDVFVDWYFVNRMLTADGVVLFDDCAKPNVRKLIRFLDANFTASYERLDLSSYRPAGRDRVRQRVAAVLGRVQLVGYRKTGSAERHWAAGLRRF
jgi:hypothetical protein